MGIDIETEYGGSGLSFFASVLAVEEIAKVEPSLSIFLHVHNSLVNCAIRNYGSEEQKQKYLPLLTQSVVSFDYNYEYRYCTLDCFLSLPTSYIRCVGF